MFSDDVKNLVKEYKNKKLTGIQKRKDSKETLNKLYDETSFLPEGTKIRQRFYHVENDINYIPKCHCGNFLTWDHAYDSGYNKFCSNECRGINKRNNVQEYLEDKEWLVDQHHNKRKRIYEIADQLGISEYPVREAMNKLNVETINYKKKTNEVAQYLEDKEWLYEKYINEKLTFQQIADLLGHNTSKTIVWRYVSFHGFETRSSNHYPQKFNRHSQGECDVLNTIKEINPDLEIQTSNRSILEDGKEIDIFLPEYNLAIEYDGLYYHSELGPNNVDSNYHLEKTNKCEEKNIKLLHIFENEWLHKQDIWKSILTNHLEQSNRIFARKTSIADITKAEKNRFLDDNHLQGSDSSSFQYGLYYNDELVSVITFAKSRYNKTYEWELTRFATKKNWLVVGGFSKLLKHAINNINIRSIISYADRRISQGNLYANNGFSFIHSTKPRYWYFHNNKTHLYHRQNFQKQFLETKLDFYDPSLTEWDNMKLNGYNRIWDCGQLAFVWTMNST